MDSSAQSPATHPATPPRQGPWKAGATSAAPPPPRPSIALAPSIDPPKPARAKAMSMRQIFNLIAGEFPSWTTCLDELADARNSHPQLDIKDQVSGIWRRHGLGLTPMISQAKARKIWDQIPNSNLDPRPICDAVSVTVGSFVSRALVLSNGR